jgi:hypothetical protein
VRSVEVAPRGRRPPIRLRPVPQFDPPFDDELSPDVWAGAHQLAFDWSGLAGAATPGAATPGAATPDTVAGPAGRSGADIPGPRSPEPGSSRAAGSAVQTSGAGGSAPQGPALAGASADAKRAVRSFVAMCVEVLNGYRPAAHLRRLSHPSQAAGVVAQALAAAHRVADLRRGAGRGARPTRGTRAVDRHGRRPDPVAVLKLRLCEPRPGAVEAAVLLVTGDRTWAMALRLEHHQQSWAATVLRLV